MKKRSLSKLVLIAVIIISTFSCEGIIGPLCGCAEAPLPGPGVMEGYFQYEGWYTKEAKAIISDGRIILTGHDQSTIQFSIEASAPGRYPNGTGGQKNLMLFTPTDGELNRAPFSSAYTDFPEFAAASVEILAIDERNKTITGRFDGYLSTGDSALSIYGAFNKIPYVEAPYNVFSATVNESAFSPLLVSAREDHNKIIAQFSQANGAMIKLSLPSDISTGNYPMGPTVGVYITSGAETCVAIAGGSITITENNITLKRLTGTFNFTSEPTLTGDEGFNVEDASFTVYY